MSLVRGNTLRAGLILLAGILAVVMLAVGINLSFGMPLNINLGWPPGQDYSLRAAFSDANGVARGATVVVSGNPIGQVTDVHAAGRQSLVTMRIDRHYAPLHQGTIARIRYSTLLAQKYIELTPAAGTATIKDGATIPSDQTVTPVDFDQFLSSLDPQTRQRLQVLIQQGAAGVDGRSQDINGLLDQLSQLSMESRAGLSTFHAHDADLDSITANLAVTSDRLAQSHQQLGDFIANSAAVNGELAANDAALDSLLVHLANTMDDFNQTLNGNEQNLHGTVVTLDPLLTEFNSALGTLNPLLQSQLGPFTTWGTGQLIPNVGSAISVRDANGNYLRQYLIVDSCYDSINKQPSHPAGPTNSCSSAGAPPAPGGPQLQAPRGLPAAPKLSLCPTPPTLPTPAPPALPTPVPTLTPCPTPIPPCIPAPGHPSPTPSPTLSPGSCTPGPGTVNPNGAPIPAPLPSELNGTLGSLP